MNYRVLNEIIIRNRNAFSLIRDTLFHLASSRFYSKFDVIAAFNAMRIKSDNEHKTAFLFKYELYEFLVMSFGLCNAPAIFQAYINSVLHSFLNRFMSIYLNNVFIYSKSQEKHIRYIN